MISNFNFFAQLFPTCADFTALKEKFNELKLEKNRKLYNLRQTATFDEYLKESPAINSEYDKQIKSEEVTSLEQQLATKRPMGEAIMLYEKNLKKMKKSDHKYGAQKFTKSITQTHEFPKERDCDEKYQQELRTMIMKTPPEGRYKERTESEKTKLREALQKGKTDEIEKYIMLFTKGTEVEKLLGCEVEWIMRHFGMNVRKAKKAKKGRSKRRRSASDP